MDERQFRNKIYWLTFLFSILVIWIHSFNAELFLGSTQAGVRVEQMEYILGEYVGQIAVPGFFVVSSYLFYRRFNWGRLLSKWKSRARSILLPYLLWNLLYYAGYVVVTRLPGISGLAGKPQVPFNMLELFLAAVNFAYNPVFWYLQQLIILIALAPIIYLAFKNTVTGVLVMGGIVYALWNNWNFPILNMDALFYTCAAALVSLHREGWGRFAEEKMEERWITASVATLLSLYGLLIFLGCPGKLLYARPLLTVLYRLLGVAAACLAVKALPLPDAKEWMKHNFFLYAVHFAWVRLFNKAGALIFPAWPAVALMLFVLMPVFMVAINIIMVKAMSRWCPHIYRVLSGGR